MLRRQSFRRRRDQRRGAPDEIGTAESVGQDAGGALDGAPETIGTTRPELVPQRRPAAVGRGHGFR
jgi:hypothetical protein